MAEESTTPDLVELVRGTIDPLNVGDIDASLRLYAPDAFWDLSSLGLGTFEGVAAIRGFLEEWISSYEGYEVKGEEILDLGNGIGFAVMRQGGRPLGSTGHVQERFASVATWVDGLLVRTVTYLDIDEARAAAERLAEERE
ncbi:MAG TPA: nuclear transport factor 2 family protein [Solirubrobacteraceae bacterium]|nr:nuclear transport factor 2 family protein [Solirubrobacteraceae bacterium]